jgi:hypothetical protein
VDTLGEIARTEFGLRLYTHNHDGAYNFLLDSGPLDALGRPTRSSGIRMLEYFFGITDKKFVFFEMDVCWAHVAQHRFFMYTDPDGNMQTNVYDPAATVAARTTRFPLFHFKDGMRTADPPGGRVGLRLRPLRHREHRLQGVRRHDRRREATQPDVGAGQRPRRLGQSRQSLAFAEISYNMAALFRAARTTYIERVTRPPDRVRVPPRR